jgi:catechol 2,3-dioxygenase-like lactoylglutathione lyase family enzyme
MKLNHLDLQVSDVPGAVAYFERYFDLEVQSNRDSKAIAILSDRHGFVLVLQRFKGKGEAYPEGFHIGFLVDDVDTVHRVHAKVEADGVKVSDVIANNRGTMIYCSAPDGILVEVSCPRVRFGGGDPMK